MAFPPVVALRPVDQGVPGDEMPYASSGRPRRGSASSCPSSPRPPSRSMSQPSQSRLSEPITRMLRPAGAGLAPDLVDDRGHPPDLVVVVVVREHGRPARDQGDAQPADHDHPAAPASVVAAPATMRLLSRRRILAQPGSATAASTVTTRDSSGRRCPIPARTCRWRGAGWRHGHRQTTCPDTESCYRAVKSRDRRFDGVFYTAVRTTGIYCRPSCPAPRPRSQRHVPPQRGLRAGRRLPGLQALPARRDAGHTRLGRRRRPRPGAPCG